MPHMTRIKHKINHSKIIKQIKSQEWKTRRQRSCCRQKNKIFLEFSLVFKKYIQEKTLKDFLLLSIDAHKISTVTVSDHVKPYAAVVVEVSKKVMRECGHLKFMLGDIIKVSL